MNQELPVDYDVYDAVSQRYPNHPQQHQNDQSKIVVAIRCNLTY